MTDFFVIEKSFPGLLEEFFQLILSLLAESISMCIESLRAIYLNISSYIYSHILLKDPIGFISLESLILFFFNFMLCIINLNCICFHLILPVN